MTTRNSAGHSGRAGALRFPAVITWSVAASVLLLQLVETRIYSVVYWNHVVYLIISVALLGFGISGTWLAFGTSTWLSRRLGLTHAAVAYGVTALLSAFCVPRLGVALDQVLKSLPHFGGLLLTYGAAVMPYFFAGWILGLIYRDHPRRIFFLYFADLAGAATGCILFLVLIGPLGAIWLVLLAAALASGPLCWQVLQGRRRVAALTALACVLAALGICRKTIGNCIRPEPTKGLVNLYTDLEEGDRKIVEFSEWNSFSRTDAVSTLRNPLDKRIFIDGDAFTRVATEPVGREPKLVDGVFALKPKPESVLVIGSGGGLDVQRAVRAGAGHVDAVEINPTTVRLMRRQFAKVTDNLYFHPVVDVHIEEGRSFVRRTDQQYDIIIISSIDTFSALSNGAYVLSENYLYTVEAMTDYVQHLKPGGVLFIARWSYLPESVRLFAVALEALHDLKTQQPEQCLAAYAYGGWMALYVSNARLTNSDLSLLDETARRRGTAIRLFPPANADYFREHQRLLREYAALRSIGHHHAFLERFPYDVAPVWDDSPFFFNYDRIRNVVKVFENEDAPGSLKLIRGHWAAFTLVSLLGITTVAVFVFMFLPLAKRGRAPIEGFGLWLVYFACLGVSFIFVEISLMQRFALLLGHPARSLAIVLAGLLFFAGTGSAMSVRVRPVLFFPMVIIGILGAAQFLPWTLNQLLSLPLVARATSSLLLIAPLGFFMGMPFPTGLRTVARSSRDAVPWMLGVNGGATVLGSILAIALAMHTGFTVVLLVSAASYTIAGTAFWRLKRLGRT